MSRDPSEAAGWGAGTRCVWAGEASLGPDGATVPPVYHGVTYGYDDMAEWKAVALGERPGHIYSRNTNPTVELFERKVQELEGAEAATAFATGMAAISDTLSALLAPGDRVVSITDTYGGANRIFTEFLPRLGVEVTLVPTHDAEALAAEIDRGCSLVYLETPTNPTLKVVDIARMAESARAVGATVVVDSTFATPINQRPLELGADLVLHSATKFMGGHSDAMGGVVAGSEALVGTIFRYREINGASLDPMSAFLLTRGLKTLELRVERQNANALEVARFLSRHPAVEAVYYPGLESHPGHEIARRQMRGFGGVLSFALAVGDVGDVEAVETVETVGTLDTLETGESGEAADAEDLVARFLGGLGLAHRAASLGSVATLVGPPSTTSHVELTREARARAGIPEALIRYSVGIENPSDLVADLERALGQIGVHA
ncbi:MAG: aminotransferase class V-fold PLP-dependent enzyme [Gemmatimonadales bacterium]|nr:MAG: aminotransferase class V-fold PLP-dependent enzyme [Gemmatimonadales bacterium]